MIRKALCVGMNYCGSSEIPELECCVDDAISVCEVHRTNKDGSPNFDVVLLEDRHSHGVSRKTRSNVVRLFQGYCDICLFYFSGHGYVDNIGEYLVTSDCDPEGGGLSLVEEYGSVLV